MHPVLIHVPWLDFDIYSYGVMIALSMTAGWNIVAYLGVRERYFQSDKENREFIANAFMVCAGVALVASRLLYIATNPDEFSSLADWVNLRNGGLVAYGGFLGGFFAAIGYVRLHRGVALLRFSDTAAPALALGLGVTRIGCYLFGCDFGARLEADAPGWLRSLGTFPRWEDGTGSPAWAHHVNAYGLSPRADHSFAVHPTQLYESSIGFLLFAFTIALWWRRRFHGEVLLSLAIAYGLWRFGIEFVRDDPERGAALGFSTSQLISLAIVPIAALFYARERALQRVSGKPVMKLADVWGKPPPVDTAPTRKHVLPADDA